MEGDVETDPIRMLGVMLGIPGASVVDGQKLPTGVWLAIETSQKSGRCPECGHPAAADGVEPNELGTFSAMGQAVTIEWRRQMWRCEFPGCPLEPFAEEDEGVTAFLARAPQTGRTPARSDQSGLPA
jgi:hypothetical protein